MTNLENYLRARVQSAQVRQSDNNDFDILPRLDASFISIYTANISIIHGATLSVLVFRMFDSLIRTRPLQGKYAEFVYSNHTQLICCAISVFAIMCWIAMEYYWFMALVRRRPHPFDTLLQFLLGAGQISAAYFVTMPRYFIWATLSTAVIGLVAYKNNLRAVGRARIPKRLLDLVRQNLRRGVCILLLCTVLLALVFWRVARPGGPPLLPKSSVMTWALLLITSSHVISASIVGYYADKIVSTAEKIPGIAKKGEILLVNYVRNGQRRTFERGAR